MRFRSTAAQAFGAVLMAAMMAASSNAQVARRGNSSTATQVTAEMTKGKLNPTQTKPGDQIVLRLKNDVKSNGVVLLKKGMSINGVVRNVKTSERKGQPVGQAQSMMQIDWIAPTVQGKNARQLSIALQYVAQMKRPHQQGEASGDDLGKVGVVGGAPETPAGVASSVSNNVGVPSSGSSTHASGHSNIALLNMPSVLAADRDTAVSLERDFGLSPSGPLFKVGHGQVVSSGGSKQSVDLYSHFNNDTVITSREKSFEISSGAQMQLLVGVRK